MNKPIQSKINWTAGIIAFVTILLVAFGVSPEIKSNVLIIVNAVGIPAIMAFRTWFTEKG